MAQTAKRYIVCELSVTPWLEQSRASKNIHRQTDEYHVTLENRINVIITPF